MSKWTKGALATAIAVSLCAMASQAMAEETVKIAIAGPQTGPVAQYGDMEFAGAKVAVDQINAAGGVNGHTLKHVLKDDGYQTAGAGGAQGLEIFRGDADMGFVAQIMFTGLQGQGWHLRMAQRKGIRSVYVYERGSTMATLTIERETMGTVLAIWVADRMPDGATLPMQENTGTSGYGGGNSGSGSPSGYSESSGGGGGMNSAPKPGFSESWGGSNKGGIQERNL